MFNACAHKMAGLLVVGMFACLQATAAVAQDGDLQMRGKDLAERLCSRCHAVGADEESALAAAPAFRELAQMWPLEQLEESLAEGIVTGHPDMPEFVFSTEDIDALLTYLAAINQ